MGLKPQPQKRANSTTATWDTICKNAGSSPWDLRRLADWENWFAIKACEYRSQLQASVNQPQGPQREYAMREALH